MTAYPSKFRRGQWSRDEIAHRNQQYERMSRVKTSRYRIETRTGDEPWVFRMENYSPGYLKSCGRRWIECKFCTEFRVVEMED